jgi:hypothetical protein
VIRGHNVMKGYWKRPESTAEAIRDGWFHRREAAVIGISHPELGEEVGAAEVHSAAAAGSSLPHAR